MKAVRTHGRGGLDRFDRNAGKVTLQVPLRNAERFSFYEDNTGVFWLYSNANGLAVFDRGTRRLTRYTSYELDDGEAIKLTLTAILRTGPGFAFGTEDDGLLKLDRERRRFVRYRHHPGNPDSPFFKWVGSLLQDGDGTIWVRTDRGVHLFPPKWIPSNGSGRKEAELIPASPASVERS